MSNNSTPCTPPESNEKELLLMALNQKIDELKNDTNLRLLATENKTAELCIYIKQSLSNYLRDLFASMKLSGEIDDVIKSAISDIELDIYNSVIYYGDSIKTTAHRDVNSNTDYYVTVIPTADADGNSLSLRVGIANDDKSFGTLESTLAFANRKNATLAINAGFFNMTTHKPSGSIIQDGNIVYSGEITNLSRNYIGIDKKGKLRSFPYNTNPDVMKRSGITQAICGGAVLIENGAPVALSDNSPEPRQAIGQRANGNIIIITCDGRTRNDNGMSLSDLTRIFQTFDVISAYNLDGGGSTSTVLRGIKQNKNIDNGYTDRAVSTFLYIKKPTVQKQEQIISDAFKEVGKLKQDITKRFQTLVDIEAGYLRLRGKEEFFLPGIEAYANAETSRCGKFGYHMTPGPGIKRNFYATLRNEDGVEQTVFRARADGLVNINGLMADFQSYAHRTPNSNLNTYEGASAMFYTYDADTGSPGIGACIVLHLRFSDNPKINVRQIAIPLNENRPVLMRARNSSGEWGRWYQAGVNVGASSARPMTSYAGTLYFDTTLKKPIWYDGNAWRDAAGDIV